LDRYGHFSTQ